MDKKDIEREIQKTKSEIAMKNSNDGWWNEYMLNKLDKLEKSLNNDNDRIFDKKHR